MLDWRERLHHLDYDSAVAVRYHGRRKAFLDKLSRFAPALSIVLGCAAFATIVGGHPFWAEASAVGVTAVSAGNLAFGWGDRARVHEGLFRDWNELRGELAMLDEGDDRTLRQIEVKRTKLDASSPGQMLALSVMCENEEKKMRQSGALYHVGGLQRAIANFMTLPGWSPAPLGG